MVMIGVPRTEVRVRFSETMIYFWLVCLRKGY